MSTVIARTVTAATTPLMLLVAVALFLQGHNLPGGGFIAGVLTAAAITLVYVVYSLEYVESNLFTRERESMERFSHPPIETYRDLFALGLAVAAGSGLAAAFLGLPFLTQDFWVLHVPLFNEVHLASAVVFDLGVYLVVVGGLLAIIAVVGAE